jgi:hypothetical protein
MKKHTFLLVVLCGALAAVAGAQGAKAPAPAVSADYLLPGPVVPLAPPLAAAVNALRAPLIAAHISFLASPAMEGRGLGTHSLEATAEYIAAMLAMNGVPPFSPTDKGNAAAPYFQPVPLREISRPSGQLTIEARSGDRVESRAFLPGVDCLLPELPPVTIAAPVVFAGYGIREASPARDDYRGLDVKDRIVLVLGGVPDGADWQTPVMLERYAAEGGRQRYAAKVEAARALGARAVIAIEGDGFAQTLAADGAKPAPTFFAAFDPTVESPPVLRVSRRAGDAMLAAAGLNAQSARTEAPRPLPGIVATLRTTGDQRLITPRNVLGILRGSDPALRDEAVVIGAHMDHLGRAGETWYPGADDNASGTAALLEMARVFAGESSRPKRTIVFAFWTGEEEGHLGSEHYGRHPLWPIDRTSVYLNLDMIAHPWTMEEIRKLVADTGYDKGSELLGRVKPVDFLELGVADSAPELAPVLMAAARGTGVALHLDRTDGKSGGSDYREFARRGRPFVRFFGNYFPGYHEPTDTIEGVDPAQVLKMTRLAFASAWLLANR